VVTTATGLGTAIFDSATSRIGVTINVQGLDWGPLFGLSPQTLSTADDVTGAYIFYAARGANGPVVFGLH
jgi:serralysin